MKKVKLFEFHSLYQKFAVIFICIWFTLNSMMFSVLFHIVSKNKVEEYVSQFQKFNVEMKAIRVKFSVTFVIFALIGAIIILLVLRQIVKPVKQLSIAAKEVAKGNFNVQLKETGSDEIGRLNKDFNTMVHQLKSMDTLRKDFVSNVSHEFRTPMTSLKGFAVLLRDSELSKEQQKEYSEIIIQESERLLALSNDLLWISELDNNSIPKEKETYFLDEQIRKVVLFLEPLWSKKNLNFEIELETVQISGQKDLLWQVWLNLIQNAIKFSHEEGTIYLTATKKEQNVEIVITDEGIGMSQEAVSRVFERFYKEDNARTIEGNGLGLVICKKIIEISNGNIEIESEKGKGALMRITLPL